MSLLFLELQPQVASFAHKGLEAPPIDVRCAAATTVLLYAKTTV